jgi:prepilin-type processing-associated H-X9-DG protein
MKRRAITLVELMVATAVAATLIILLFPAVQSARETSRRLQCSSNARQLALALHSYEGIFRVLPNTAQNNYSFHVSLLPYLEQKSLYDEFDFSVNAMDYRGPLRWRRAAVFECPSDDSRATVVQLGAVTNFHGNWGTGTQRYGNNGIFSYCDDHPGFVRFLPFSAVTDGLSQTAMLGEVLAFVKSSHRLRILWNVPAHRRAQFDEFADACRSAPRRSSASKQLIQMSRGRPWLESGMNWTVYNHVLTPNQASCTNGTNFLNGVYTSSSFHNGVVNVAMVDGSIQNISDSIDITPWRALGSRAGDP